ncbi:MAG: PAS domain-containing protein [Deltaproteobacteria bacterium]|jgi:PAS domain S-box-containing protein|nr:PAS domain-containing protein [Deltaproteobacteria bacterium]
MDGLKIFPQGEIPQDVFASVLTRGKVGLWELRLGPNGFDGAALSFDETSRRMFLDPKAEAGALDFIEFSKKWIHPLDREVFLFRLESVAMGEYLDMEARLWSPAIKGWEWCELVGRPFVQEGSEEPQRFFGLIEAIHERRLAQEALQKALEEKDVTTKELLLERERLAAVIDAGELGTWDWEIQTGKVIYNKRWAEIIGYNLDEIKPVVDTWEKALLPEDLERANKAVEAHCQGLTPRYDCVFRLRHRDGSIVWAQDRGRVVERDENGEAHRLIGVMIDVSHQKRIEQSLAENNEQLALIFNAARIGAWDWDVANGTIKFNDVYLDMLGYTPEEITGTIEEWESFVHPDELEATNAALERALSGEDSMYASEIRMRHKDGHYVWTYDFGRVVTWDEQGNALRMVGGHFDFDDRKKMEMEFFSMQEHERDLRLSRDLAEESARAKSEFLANMSHEIRTPMNAIIGLTHLVLETELNEQQVDYIHRTEMAAQALLRIINDILDFSKIEAGKLEMEETSFQLTDVLNGTVDVLEVTAVSKGLDFTLSLDPKAPVHLLGDPVRLGQILNNLSSNAIKFTANGGVKVEVSVEERSQDNALLLFKVTDSGIGLSPEQIKGLFTPFTQADTSTTRKYGGTGLGLTISKRLVEMMDGRIWCESEVGKGSVFSFTARLKIDQKGQESLDKTKAVGAVMIADNLKAIRGAKILLTEDNEVNQLVASRILGKAGFEVKIANNGVEAVNMIQAETFDLVLMDIQMPEMDGLTATRTIRSMAGFESIPIVAMTAHAMSGDRELSLAAGMNDHISKPINLPELYQALLKWVPAKATTIS